MPPPSKNKRSATDVLMRNAQTRSGGVCSKGASVLATARKRELQRRDNEKKHKQAACAVSTAAKKGARINRVLMISDAESGIDAATAQLIYSLLSSHYGTDTSPEGLNNADANMLYGPRAGISTVQRLMRAVSNGQLVPTRCKDKLECLSLTHRTSRLSGIELQDILLSHARECTNNA